jgi:hypothetical protein
MDANADPLGRPAPGRQAASRKAAPRTRRSSRDVRADDRFAKVTDLLEAAQTVWIVVHPVDLPGLPRHIKLIREDEPHRAVTVALSALLDRRLYRRLDPVPQQGADEQP